jgi:F-type H+-transporting ATPase subunit delta
MAKTVGKLATRYAKALLAAVIREQGSQGSPTPAQSVAKALKEFAGLWQREHSLSVSLQNPMFEKNERANALVKIAEEAGLPDIAVRFLRVCFERERIAALPEIAQAFSDAADADAGILQVEIITARSISTEETKAIEQGLTSQLHGTLSFRWRIEPEILGGLIVRYGGKILDGSLAGRLTRIEHKLQHGV